MTPKQERFVAEYLIDLNATQAAIRAGYSPQTATVQGCQNLTKPNIRQAIEIKKTAQLALAEIRAQDVLNHTRHVAFSDPRKLLDSSGAMLAMKDWSDETAAAFSPLEIMKRNLTAGDGVQEDVVKVKAWDKLKALEMLAKHLGLLEEKLRVSGGLTVKWEGE